MREAFILAPDDAPDFVHDRAELWNRVEEMETRKNARLGREVQLGLAYELTHDEQRALVRDFAEREFVEKGFVVDVAIHNYGRTIPSMGLSEDKAQRIRDWAEAGIPFLSRSEAEGLSEAHVLEVTSRDGTVTGYKLYQPHAHLRITPRVVEDGTFVDDKQASRELNRAETAMAWRYEWPKLQNAYLEDAGAEVRVSSTSTEEDQFPDIRFLGRGPKQETRSIEDRAEELSDAQVQAHAEAVEAEAADEQFRQMHNAAIKNAFTEMEEPDGSMSEEGERTRLALWWNGMSQRFSQWRYDFREKAEEWRDRLDQHSGRIRAVLGWGEREEPEETVEPHPSTEIETPEAEHWHDGPEQEEPDR